LVLAFAWFGAAPARAQPLEARVKEVRLENGMRFLLVRRGTAPVFAAILRFRVGSADDRTGETGLAHLFEHLAFKGTSRIGVRDPAAERQVLDDLDQVVRDLQDETGKGDAADAARLTALRERYKDLRRRGTELVVKDEFSDILTSNGAAGLNARTSPDVTSYYVSLPANRLELWCLMESARLRDPVLREFYSERDVVMEERRYRIDNHPQGRLYEQLLVSAFIAHPYRVPGVGWMSDLQHLTRPQAETFRRAYYVPNNAVGALVGDIEPAAAEALLRRYFSSIPAGPRPASPGTTEPPQAGERRVTVEFDAEPQILIAFHKPGLQHPDDPVFEIIDGVLSSGRTGRLFRRLVTQDQVASDVSTFQAPGQMFPNLYTIGAEPRAPHTAEDVERAVLAELQRLSEEPVLEAELEKIRNQVEADTVYDLRSSTSLAAQLSYFEILTGDWRNLVRRTEAIRKVTPAQVQDVARRTFTASNRTVALLARPGAAAAPPPAGGGGAPR
jgi:predicted Zn-dependent peptidase